MGWLCRRLGHKAAPFGVEFMLARKSQVSPELIASFARDPLVVCRRCGYIMDERLKGLKVAVVTR